MPKNNAYDGDISGPGVPLAPGNPNPSGSNIQAPSNMNLDKVTEKVTPVSKRNKNRYFK